jgi:hypothetical protein
MSRFVFWDVLPCNIIVDRRFRGTCCLNLQGDPVQVPCCAFHLSFIHLLFQSYHSSCDLASYAPVHYLFSFLLSSCKPYGLGVSHWSSVQKMSSSIPVASLTSKSCLTTCHEGAWGKMWYSSYSFLTSALDASERSASRPDCALPQGKDPRFQVYKRLGGSQPVWMQRSEEKSLACARDRTSIARSSSP